MTWLLFALDHGPDILGAIPHIVQSIAALPSMLLACVWCFMHQFHLSTEGLLRIVDGWQWGVNNIELEVKCWSGVAIVSNCWRAPGVGRKMHAAAARWEKKQRILSSSNRSHAH